MAIFIGARRALLCPPVARTGGGGGGAQLVALSGHEFSTATDTFSFGHTGAQPGDVLIGAYTGSANVTPTFTMNGSSTPLANVAGDNWAVGEALRNCVYAHVLTTADLSNGTITAAGAETWGTGLAMAIYRGGSVVTRKSFGGAADGVSTCNVTGYAQGSGPAIAVIGARSNGLVWTLGAPAPFVVDGQHSGYDAHVLNFSFTANAFCSATSGVTTSTYTFAGFPTDPGSEAITLLDFS